MGGRRPTLLSWRSVRTVAIDQLWARRKLDAYQKSRKCRLVRAPTFGAVPVCSPPSCGCQHLAGTAPVSTRPPWQPSRTSAARADWCNTPRASMPPHRQPEWRLRIERLYRSSGAVYNPYLDCQVLLTDEGLQHLRFSGGRERSPSEQASRYRLLPVGLDIIRRSGTVQEYRRTLQQVVPTSKHGERPMRPAEYWGFVAIAAEGGARVRAIVRRIGTGDVIFWSVMWANKFRPGTRLLASDSLGND